MPNLSNRLQEDEILDNLQLGGESLHRTLRDLAHINRLLLNTRAITQAVLKIVDQSGRNPNQELVIVDLGCGGGDILIHLNKVLQKKNIKAKLIGIDGNSSSIAYCRQLTQASSTLDFQVQDILASNFILPPCDIMLSSHFVYHLGASGLTSFIDKQRVQIRNSVIISELVRNSLAYYLFRLVSRFLGLGKITRQDGMTAIRRAFTFHEFEQIISKLDFAHKKHYRFMLFRQIAVLSVK